MSLPKSLLNLNDIPEPILRLIMLRLPLQDRIPRRIICHKWKRIIEDTFLLVRSLKLFDSYDTLTTNYCPMLLERGLQDDRDLVLRKHESDDLVLGGMPVECTAEAEEYDQFVRDADGEDLNNVPNGGGHFLVHLFPNVEKLVLAPRANSNRIDFEHLLASFAPQLTTFATTFRSPFLIQNLFGSYGSLGPGVLGSFSNLRALHLHKATFGMSKRSLRRLSAQSSPILPQLETLSIEHLCPACDELKLVTRTRSLKHLSIDSVSSISIKLIVDKNAQLARQLESLSIRSLFTIEAFPLTSLVDSICTNFASICTLHLNLTDGLQRKDQLKTLAYLISLFCKLPKLANLSFQIESDYFNLTIQEIATIPVMRNIVNLKVELANVNKFTYAARRINRLERCLLVIFPSATQIRLATPYREDVAWQAGRDRLERMVERNAPIMRMHGTEEVEVDVAPLLGRHEDKYRRECLGEGLFGLYEGLGEDGEEEEEVEEEYEEDEQSDQFLGISVELLGLMSNLENLNLLNPFLTDDLLKKMEAFKQVLSTYTPALYCEDNYETMLNALNGIFTEHVAVIATRQIALLALDCIRLIATESKRDTFPMQANSWICSLLCHFGSENVLGQVVTRLNGALDAICDVTSFDVMVNQIEVPLEHLCSSVRKATALFIYRALVVNGDTFNVNSDSMKSLRAKLVEARNNPAEIEDARLAIQLALLECEKVM